MNFNNLLVVLKFILINSIVYIPVCAYNNSDLVNEMSKIDNNKGISDMRALLNKQGENILITSSPTRKKFQDLSRILITQSRSNLLVGRPLKDPTNSVKHLYSGTSIPRQSNRLRSYPKYRHYQRISENERLLSSGELNTQTSDSISVIQFTKINNLHSPSLKNFTDKHLNSDTFTNDRNQNLSNERSLHSEKVLSRLLHQLPHNLDSSNLKGLSEITNLYARSNKVTSKSRTKRRAKIEKRSTNNSIKIRDLIPPPERMSELAQISFNSIIAVLKTVPGKIFLYKTFL